MISRAFELKTGSKLTRISYTSVTSTVQFVFGNQLDFDSFLHHIKHTFVLHLRAESQKRFSRTSIPSVAPSKSALRQFLSSASFSFGRRQKNARDANLFRFSACSKAEQKRGMCQYGGKAYRSFNILSFF